MAAINVAPLNLSEPVSRGNREADASQVAVSSLPAWKCMEGVGPPGLRMQNASQHRHIKCKNVRLEQVVTHGP